MRISSDCRYVVDAIRKLTASYGHRVVRQVTYDALSEAMLIDSDCGYAFDAVRKLTASYDHRVVGQVT